MNPFKAARILVRTAMIYAITAAICAAHAQALKLERITLTVSDLKRTEAFYRDGLGFERVGQARYDDAPYAHLIGIPKARVDSLRMRLGSEEVEFQRITPAGRAYPRGSRSPDLWFQHFAIIVSDMERAYAQLRRQEFEAISTGGPQTLPPGNGSVKAFKFRDPDGHPLELLYFPKGVGRPVWNEGAGDRLFLGIDHTAIGVSDTPRSEAFYGGLLGMDRAYAVTNTGPTQENLDGTFNAVVQITGLRPERPEGAGVEFLDYRSPATGRAPPPDTFANDLVHAHMVVSVEDLERTARDLAEARVPMTSGGVVEVDRAIHGFGKGLMVRDPDGHEVLLVQ
jgi:catechol 2,3-dioxygenase-like lactoylglutathione lyase family enzyme